MKKKDANMIKKILKEWRESHPAEYAEFLRTVDAAMNDGDVTLFLRNIFVLKNAQPKGFWTKLDGLADKIVFSSNEREKMESSMIDANTPSGSISLIDIITTGIYALKHKDKVANSLAETKPVQLWCMYYWLFWEDGANKLEMMLSRDKGSKKHSWWMRPMIKLAVRTIVKISVKNLMSSKDSWSKTIKSESDEEIKEEIASVLAVTKGTGQGRSEKDDDLENLLIGNIPEVLNKIEYFVRNRKNGNDSQLADILIALEKSGHIKKDLEFMTFYRAIIRRFPDAGITGYDSAQRKMSRLSRDKAQEKMPISDFNVEIQKMYFSLKETDLVG